MNGGRAGQQVEIGIEQHDLAARPLADDPDDPGKLLALDQRLDQGLLADERVLHLAELDLQGVVGELHRVLTGLA